MSFSAFQILPESTLCIDQLSFTNFHKVCIETNPAEQIHFLSYPPRLTMTSRWETPTVRVIPSLIYKTETKYCEVVCYLKVGFNYIFNVSFTGY